jgi:hypothetical protein
VEWLSSLPSSAGWKELFQTFEVPVTNPMVSALSESKRFPLALRGVSGCPTWKSLIPECRDPRDVRPADWDQWVLKASYSNTGDEVYICGKLSRKDQGRIVLKAQRRPMHWIAQRRFETLSLNSSSGPLYPCLGIFVVDGRASGAYARLSFGQVTDGSAREAPLFIDRTNFTK